MITNKQDCMDFIYHHEMMAKNRVNAKYNKLNNSNYSFA